MNTTAYTTQAHGKPDQLQGLTDAALVATLATHNPPPANPAAARALVRQHQKAGTRIPLHGCSSPCPRAHLGCRGFDPLRGCAGYAQPSTWKPAP